MPGLKRPRMELLNSVSHQAELAFWRSSQLGRQTADHGEEILSLARALGPSGARIPAQKSTNPLPLHMRRGSSKTIIVGFPNEKGVSWPTPPSRTRTSTGSSLRMSGLRVLENLDEPGARRTSPHDHPDSV